MFTCWLGSPGLLFFPGILLVCFLKLSCDGFQCLVFQAAVQDRLNEQEGVPSVFNPPPSRPLQVNTADHRVYSYIVSRPQPRVSLCWMHFFTSGRLCLRLMNYFKQNIVP